MPIQVGRRNLICFLPRKPLGNAEGQSKPTTIHTLLRLPQFHLPQDSARFQVGRVGNQVTRAQGMNVSDLFPTPIIAAVGNQWDCHADIT